MSDHAQLATAERDQTFSPTGGVQQRYTQRHVELVQHVKESGLLRRRYGFYWTTMSVTVVALAATVTGVVLLGDSWFQLILAGVLAIIFGQLAFLGHDAEHQQIFRSSTANTWAGLIHGTLLGGLSLGWWQGKHSRHHANPNKQDKDPDVAPGVVAFTPHARAQRGRLGTYLADRQGWFFIPLLLLEGFQLHLESVKRLTKRNPLKRRGWEIAFLGVRFAAYVALLLLVMPAGMAAAFLAVQIGIFGLYLGGVFAPNHVGMPTVQPDLKLDFLRRQVLMSRNVTGGWFIQFALGGLNYQIEHHLFPSMPRPNLPYVQPLVRRLCDDHGIAYTEQNLLSAYSSIIRYLNNVGLHGRDPFGCPLAAQLRASS